MKLHILGCGGYIPVRNETSCFLVEHKGHLIMLDAGTGVSNLRNYDAVLEKYEEISVILTHFHLDHIVGLAYIIPYIRDKKLNIYGPGISGYGKSTKELLTEVMRHPYFTRLPDKLTDVVGIFDYEEQGFSIGDIRIGIAAQEHSDPSYRINIDGELIYATDTVLRQKADIGSTAAAKYLLHECVDIKEKGNNAHTSLEVILREFHENEFERVILVHQNPEWTDDDYSDMVMRLNGTNIEITSDMRMYSF